MRYIITEENLKIVCQLVAESVQEQYPKVDYLIPVISRKMESQLRKIMVEEEQE